eukprot:UN25226
MYNTILSNAVNISLYSTLSSIRSSGVKIFTFFSVYLYLFPSLILLLLRLAYILNILLIPLLFSPTNNCTAVSDPFTLTYNISRNCDIIRYVI